MRLLPAVFLAALSAQTIDPALQPAVEAHRQGKLDAAVVQYRAYLKTKPESVEARSNLGAALVGMGRFDEAITEYQAALRRATLNPAVSLNLALAYYKSGRIDEAARELSAQQMLRGGNLQSSLLLADCWFRLGENAKVIRLLTPLEKENPSNGAIAYLLGSAMVMEKRENEGQYLLDRVLKNGDTAEARMLLGHAKMNSGEIAAAREDFRRAVELNPELPSAHSAFGRALMATGDPAAATAAFQSELEKNPNDWQANLSLAILRKEERSYEEALKYLERLLRIRPGDLRVQNEMAQIALGQGRPEDARKLLEVVVKQAPKYREAHVALATAYYRLKRKADGDRVQEIVRQLNAEAQANQPKPNTP